MIRTGAVQFPEHMLRHGFARPMMCSLTSPKCCVGCDTELKTEFPNEGRTNAYGNGKRNGGTGLNLPQVQVHPNLLDARCSERNGLVCAIHFVS
ncbi:MAG: hypothetical protein Q8R98_21750, partial [Rubrivivax sp.]|nr:hypothetical protein [Rubrivivax sp.]